MYRDTKVAPQHIARPVADPASGGGSSGSGAMPERLGTSDSVPLPLFDRSGDCRLLERLQVQTGLGGLGFRPLGFEHVCGFGDGVGMQTPFDCVFLFWWISKGAAPSLSLFTTRWSLLQPSASHLHSAHLGSAQPPTSPQGSGSWQGVRAQVHAMRRSNRVSEQVRRPYLCRCSSSCPNV